jgi:hypothetical protein
LSSVRKAISADFGMFSATFQTISNVSFFEDAVETLKRTVGAVPHDDPIVFDPKPRAGVTHGAVVFYGSKNVKNVEETEVKKLFDKDNLGKAALNNLIIDGYQGVIKATVTE